MFSIKISDDVLNIDKAYGFSYVEEECNPASHIDFFPIQGYFIYDEYNYKIKKELLDDILMVVKTIEEAFDQLKRVAIYEFGLITNSGSSCI